MSRTEQIMAQVEEKVRSLEADNTLLRDAIINSFTSDWATPSLAR